MGRSINENRAKRTIYVTGFNSKLMTKPLLSELFQQGGPVAEVTLFETHAYILFQHDESVPYCLALFQDIEIHGSKLRLSPRARTKTTYSCLDYLIKVRDTIRVANLKITPPPLPPKTYPNDKAHSGTYMSPKKHQKTATSSNDEHPRDGGATAKHGRQLNSRASQRSKTKGRRAPSDRHSDSSSKRLGSARKLGGKRNIRGSGRRKR